MQLQGRILQRVGNAMIHQARTNRAHDYFFLSAAGNNKSADHDIVPGLDKGARRDISEQGHLRFKCPDVAAVSARGVGNARVIKGPGKAALIGYNGIAGDGSTALPP